MILTAEAILKEISKKRIIIEPFDKSSLGPASLDLTLDSQLRIFTSSKKTFIHGHMDYKEVTKLIDISEGYVLKPKAFVLGITKEKIHLPTDICGWLNSRSRFARIGLMSHITAPFICPGVSNKQVLEIYNVGPKKIKLFPGMKICQIVFQRCEGTAKYEGKFKDQTL